ncbi:MAG: hypothetical protein ABI779_22750 [Acidobacteriota bacterium]
MLEGELPGVAPQRESSKKARSSVTNQRAKDVPREPKTSHAPLRITVIGAFVAAALALLTNLYLTSSSFRHSLRQDDQARVRRGINFLTIVRDELTRVRDQLDSGLLDASISGRRLVRPQGAWPVQMWSSMRWNDDILMVDTEVLKLLASQYDQIYFANSLLEQAYNADGAANVLPMDILVEMIPPNEMPPKVRQRLSGPPEGLVASLRSYDQVKGDIRKRLPDVIAALGLSIAELQKQQH